MVGLEHDHYRGRRSLPPVPRLAAVGRGRQRVKKHDFATTVAHVEVTGPSKSLSGLQSGCGVLHTHNPGYVANLGHEAIIDHLHRRAIHGLP